MILVSFSKGGDFLDLFWKKSLSFAILILDPKQNMNVVCLTTGCKMRKISAKYTLNLTKLR